jgi:hypothetical protein
MADDRNYLADRRDLLADPIGLGVRFHVFETMLGGR